MSVVADESVDSGIIRELRQHGMNVLSVADDCPGISDVEVLKIAVSRNSLLITEDKDFGELAFRLKFEHEGIVLIRLSDLPRNNRLTLAAESIYQNLEKLKGNFSVLTKNGFRIKNITGRV